MEEEVNQRVATMMVSTSKMSAGVLARFLQGECRRPSEDSP